MASKRSSTVVSTWLENHLMLACRIHAFYFHKFGSREHFYFELLDDRRRQLETHIFCGWLSLYHDSVDFIKTKKLIAQVKLRKCLNHFMPITDYENI